MMWKEKYKIGISNIDQQHEELFRRVNDFVVSLRRDGLWNEKIETVRQTMEFMQNYVVIHFDSEEAYQKSIHYPDFEKHHQIHTEFTNEVAGFAKKFEKEGYDEDEVNKFAGKLLAWLINHVAATDQKIAEYVGGREGGRTE